MCILFDESGGSCLTPAVLPDIVAEVWIIWGIGLTAVLSDERRVSCDDWRMLDAPGCRPCGSLSIIDWWAGLWDFFRYWNTLGIWGKLTVCSCACGALDTKLMRESRICEGVCWVKLYSTQSYFWDCSNSSCYSNRFKIYPYGVKTFWLKFPLLWLSISFIF